MWIFVLDASNEHDKIQVDSPLVIAMIDPSTVSTHNTSMFDRRNSKAQSPKDSSMNETDSSSTTPIEADDQPPPASTQDTSDGIAVEVIDPQKFLSQSEHDELSKLINRVLVSIPNTGNIRVCIVDDQRMSKAHLQFSGIEGTTDVLTFDFAHTFVPNQASGFDNKVIDTDLTICFDQAKRESNHTTHTIIHELLLYTIHGVLHCLGYNDHDEKEYQRMHNKEDQLFKAAGLNALFYCEPKPDHGAQS